ncbi:hypothetical protein QTG54_016221 [Skeletonema marinoi]|uniref:Uncharacterized protein n=1 Tax=Skeletonema marinoi TaxID=267567 RepID=A0AAD8XTA2_9STRA|nr:hypothetical protein QTG54_016221 [Skeletonema marinoi]
MNNTDRWIVGDCRAEVLRQHCSENGLRKGDSEERAPGRFKIKRKSGARCETPPFVTDAVAAAVEAATEERIAQRINDAKETLDFGGSEDNSLLDKSAEPAADEIEAKEDEPKEYAPKEDEPKEDEPEEDEPKEDGLMEDEPEEDEPKSDFRKWLDSSEGDFEAKSTKTRTAQEVLGHMWLDFVETKVMPSFLCRVACGDFDEETTAASTYISEDDLSAFAQVSFAKEVSPRRRASKPRKKKSSSRKPRRTHVRR